MKLSLTVLAIVFTTILFGQNKPEIKIRLDASKSKSFDNEQDFNKSMYAKSIDSAFAIMNTVFNSNEYRAWYTNVSFPVSNDCMCNRNKNDVIQGKEIYDSMFKTPDFTWTVFFEEKSKSALGATKADSDITFAYYQNIHDDMKELPLSYAIAVNLCHEYMHKIGFCHRIKKRYMKDINKDTPNPVGYQNDIAYRVGWDVYRLVKKWKQDGKVIL